MIRRDWTDAIEAHQGEPCAVCGKTTGLELAHTVGRALDRPTGRGGARYVHPDSVITLCGPSTDPSTCHGRFDGHQLDLRPYLTPDQLAWAIDRIGYGPAMRALAGRDWT